MNIKPVHKTTLRGKQRVPRSLLDAASQYVHPTISIPAVYRPRPFYAKSLDTSVQAPRVDADQVFFVTKT